MKRSLYNKARADSGFGFISRTLFLMIPILFLGVLGCSKVNNDKWAVYETDHFIIRAKSQDVAKLNAEALETYAFPFMEWFFEKNANGKGLYQKFEIDVLKDAKAQTADTKDAFGAYQPDTKKITYGFVPDNFPQTIFHEFSHMYVHQVVFSSDTDRYMKLPGWLDEGFATFMETLAGSYRAKKPLIIEGNTLTNLELGIPVYRLGEVREDIRNGNLWPISRIAELEDRDKLGNHELGYAWSVVAFCLSEGRSMDLKTMINTYQTSPSGSRANVNIDLSNLEKEWKRWLVKTLKDDGTELQNKEK
jgi:hypothetical protein